MEHAIPHHVSEHLDTDPTHYQRLPEHLERILVELKDQWNNSPRSLSCQW